jgi:Core-2/I-Branching enzyme
MKAMFLRGFLVAMATLSPSVVSAAQSTITNATNGSDGISTKAEKNRVDTLRAKVTLKLDDVNWPADESAAARDVSILLGSTLQDRLTKLYKNANSPSCRAKIAKHYGYFINAIALEESLPFTDVTFPNECGETVYDWNDLPEGMHIGDVQNRSYEPPRNESVYIDDPSELKLLYVILTHDNANATIRLVEALYEADLHQFVIHVDAKYQETQDILLDYSFNKDYIHIVPEYSRVPVNWGGFSMVNATLQAMRYAFALDPNPSGRRPIDFHKLIHLSSSSYPLASNQEIRHKLASYPLDANFLHIIMNPTRPGNYAWHYFVECDDALHRIFQLPPLRREVNGIDMYTSSQWFIISHEFAKYLAESKPGSMVDQYLRYVEHVVVADETFFGTVLRHTEYCRKHHNTNFLHLQFDRWESELPAAKRDARKCPMPDPDHCGRSPTTMTLDYADIMELSADLFARKVRARDEGVVTLWSRDN